jgi:CHAT domain-containing protein/tetratricopeptide (TPR) repeat protein
MSRKVLLLLLLTAAPVTGQTPPPLDRGALTADAPRESSIEPRASHTFAINLEAGRAYHVEVEQLETYLDVRWKVEAHSRRANDRMGRSGREDVFWVADTPGGATLTVGNLTARPGRYRVALLSREATGADRERHAAELQALKPDIAARREASARFDALGLSHRQVRVLDRLTYLAVAQGDVAAARESGERCVSLTRVAGREEELSSCLLALGIALERAGELDRSYELALEAIAVREALGDPLLVAFAVGDSGRVLTQRGDYTASEAARRRALEISREVGDELSESINEMSLGAIASFRGRTEEALASSERGREVARRRGSREVEAIATLNAGIAYGNLGAIARAIGRIREAIVIAEAEGLKPLLAQARVALGAEHGDAGDLPSAERELAAGVALARAIGDAETVAGGEAQLGWTLARLGRADEAETRLRAAVEAAREAGSPEREATAYLYQGKARILAGRLDEAETAVERAGTMFREMARVDDEGRALLARAEIARARRDLASASARAGEALLAFESVRARVALADQRARYGALRREAYDLAVGVLVERDRLEPGHDHLARAFDLADRARGRAMVEEIAARRGGGPVPPELADAHQRALDRIGHLQQRLIQAHSGGQPDRPSRARLERELDEAVTAEETVRRRIRQSAPPTPAGATDGPTAADQARGLAADEAVLLYHVGDGASWAFLLTRDGLSVATLPGQAALRRQVDELRGLLGQPRVLGAAAYAAAARAAFDTLLRPALSGRPRLRRLRVVPDGPLWEIPFEALLTGPATSARFADLPYVVRRYTVAYQASAAGTPAAAAVAGARPDLVAFADPTFPADLATRAEVAMVTRAVFREGERFSLARLPCAQREAREVAALFGAGTSSVHLGEAARESVVKADPRVARARYLLFSTHALLSETMPSQSSLVLSLTGDGHEDGLLQAQEIDALSLDVDLVVLSGCETGLGDNVRGEGLLGLARAFFHAGARRLVASLWKVSDCSTADLTVDLFRQMRGQPDAAEALRAAKLRLLARPAYAHPYYWAPFVVLG